MSLRDPNPFNRNKPKRIALVISNAAVSRGLRQFALPILTSLMLAVCSTSRAQITAREEPPTVRTTPLFDFHSSFSVNLHQVLLHEAWLRMGKPYRQVQSTPPLAAAGMSTQEEANWNAAVSFYAAHFGTRAQFGDDELIQINDVLAAEPDNATHRNPKGLPPELPAVLDNAAAIYRKYWWPYQNESNQRWIASQKGRVQDLGPQLAAAMTKDLHQPWPKAPIRVDVCYYVVAFGYAFTTTSPSHTTFSSLDPSNQGLSGFELLFHEASHTFADTLMNALSDEGRTQHKDVGDLWHAALFYTSGVELRHLLSPSEQAGFSPYAYRYGVYDGRNWPTYRRLLETVWQDYLDGKTGFDAAIRSLVAGLT